MTLIKTDTFEITFPDDYSCWFEAAPDLVTDTIFFATKFGAQGMVELLVSQSAGDLMDFCEQAVVNETNTVSGYTDMLDEEYPDEMVTIFTNETGDHAYRHFFGTQGQFAVHIILMSGFTEHEHEEARQIIESCNITVAATTSANLERVDFTFPGDQAVDKIGDRRYTLLSGAPQIV